MFVLAPRMADWNARATRRMYGRDPWRGVPTLTVWVLRAGATLFTIALLVAMLR